MSFLLDTDLLSLLERKHVPAKLAAWLKDNDDGLFVSVVSFAELQHGLNHAPASHQPGLATWLDETRRKFAPATEPLAEPVLVRWKELLATLKAANRTMTCEDSLIAATALFHGHAVATRNKRHFELAGVPVIDPLT
jgi:predicted nucleic acid-binding protein